MIKGLIFDFDGLLVDTEYMLFRVHRDWFKEHYNYEITEAFYSNFVGLSDIDLYKYIGEEIVLNESVEAIDKIIDDIIESLIDNVQLMPGVRDFVVSAKDEDFKLAVATASPYKVVERILKRVDMFQYFDAITTQDDVTNLKPDPEVYLISLDKLNLTSDEVMIFEDSKHGLKAGNRAHCRVNMILNDITKHIKFEDAYRIYNNFTEVNVKALKKELSD